jgi:3-(3-hydroxy-phenyl)propionate hydroxylase
MSSPPLPEHVPVVIVGAGPTGVTAGIMLAQRGIECAVLDRWEAAYPLPRAVHFDDEVFRIFASLGIADKVAAISRPAPGMQLVDPQLRVLAEFRRDPNGGIHGYPQANMFDQPDLERVLRTRLSELPNARLIGGVEVLSVTRGDARPGSVRYREISSGSERVVTADAVLGCDGANSVVRDAIGSRYEDLGFEQRWLVIDAECAEPLDVYDGVQQVCDPQRTATFMMVTPGRYRWEFRLAAREQPDDLTDDVVLRLIQPWLGDAPPASVSVIRRSWYTFRGAVATTWRDGRVFLLGDAAHLTPPFIGQGMCAGIRDAANLTWKLAAVLNGAAEDRLLDTYEAERRPYAKRVIQMAIGIGWIMTGGSARTCWLRQALLRIISRLPGVEDKVIDSAWPCFKGSTLTPNRDRASGRLSPGSPWLDDVIGSGYAIVSRGHDGADAFDTATRRFFERLGTRRVSLDGQAGAFDRSLTDLLDAARANAVLLRPDGVVVASSDRVDLRNWRAILTAAGVTGGAAV